MKLDGNLKVNAVVESSVHSSIAGWFEPIGTRGGNINIVIYDGIFIEQLITVCFHECLHYFNFVNDIDNGAFNGCIKLESISLPFVGNSRTVSEYEAVFGYIFGYTSTWTRDKYSSSSSSSFVYHQYSSVNDTIWQYSCKNYYYYEYYRLQSYFYYIPSTLTNVVITDDTEIPEEAFLNCANITSITLNDEVTSIGTRAFRNCTALTSADIETGLTTIGSSAFYGDSALKSIVIPYGINTMGSYAFTNCSSLSINYQIEEQPNTWDSTWNSSSRAVTWGYGCERGTTVDGIKWISIDGEAARINGYTGTATTLTIPTIISGKTVDRISANLFASNTTITSLVIPDGITTIEANAFGNMTNFQTVVISNKIVTMQANIISGCSKASFLCHSTSKPSSWDSSWNSSNRPVVWNYSSSNGTTNGFKWNLISDGTAMIYGYSGSSTTLTIPTTVGSYSVSGISKSAFRGNTSLTSIFIPSSTTCIGAYAFNGCSNLIINCEINSQSSGWSTYRKDLGTTAYWDM